MIDIKVLDNAIEKYKTGDKKAIGTIYDSTHKTLYVYAMYMMREEVNAVGLLRETYIGVLREIDNINNGEEFLFSAKKKMYANAFNRLYRKGGFTHHGISDDSGADIAKGGPKQAVEAEIDINALRNMIKMAFAEKPEIERDVFYSYAYEDKTIDDISKNYGLEKGKSIEILQRGYKVLNETIDEYERKYELRNARAIPLPLLMMDIERVSDQKKYSLAKENSNKLKDQIMGAL